MAGQTQLGLMLITGTGAAVAAFALYRYHQSRNARLIYDTATAVGNTDAAQSVKDNIDFIGGIMGNLTGNTRGERNNNPLNIEYNQANNWRGQVGTDGRFAIFEDDKWGFRAAARILRSYQKRGINTIHSIVHTFAPSHENNSNQYASNVSQWTGISMHSPVDARDEDTVTRILQAMARMEVGRQYSYGEVNEGVKLA